MDKKKTWHLDESLLRVEPSWYGGRQEWLYKKGNLSKWTANRACGLAALGNVSLYLARTRPECEKLYPYERANEESFTEVMLRIHRYIKPTPVGIVHLRQLSRGFLRYAAAVGVDLNNNISNWNWTKENVAEYITSGLLYGSPVLLLTWNTKIRELRNHWVVVTGLRYVGEQTRIITSNWGYKKEYSLDDWIHAYSLYRGLNYFT